MIMASIESTIGSALGIDAGRVTDSLEFMSIPEWDSLNHVNLMLALETDFGTTIDEARMVELTSVARIREFIQTSGGSAGAAEAAR